MKTNQLSILFLLKQHTCYPSNTYSTTKSGLLNSAREVVNFLKTQGINANLSVVVDGNCIEKELVKYHANIVVLEAIWCPPYKVRELNKLYPNVKFIVRIHSRIPFIANEGNAIRWMKEYLTTPNVNIACNHKATAGEFASVGIYSAYLPNVYIKTHLWKSGKYIANDVIEIGCFGAIRPLKNELIQAVAAIRWANENFYRLKFHMNGSRVEQAGEPVKKNLLALFENTQHELILHEWMNHQEFTDLIHRIDLGMQVSFTETFNIVAADFVNASVPILVSNEIEWMPFFTKAATTSVDSMVSGISRLLKFRSPITYLSKLNLKIYNYKAKRIWLRYLNRVPA